MGVYKITESVNCRRRSTDKPKKFNSPGDPIEIMFRIIAAPRRAGPIPNNTAPRTRIPKRPIPRIRAEHPVPDPGKVRESDIQRRRTVMQID